MPELTNPPNLQPDPQIFNLIHGKYIQDRHAGKYYDAITAGIDFTARDLQNELKAKGLPWERAKAWDNSAVIGSWIPVAELKNRNEIDFSLQKNKEQVQKGNTRDMIFAFDEIVAFISNYFSINIGDLIFTGTPAGVGEAVVGDVLEGFVDEKNLFSVEVK